MPPPPPAAQLPTSIFGAVSTLAGNINGGYGSSDGIGTQATFFRPTGVAYGNGFVYVADDALSLIRSVDLTSGAVTTLAGFKCGDTECGYQDGIGTFATFFGTRDVTYGSGHIYIADAYNHIIRSVHVASGAVSTLAGFYCGKIGGCGQANGIGTFATFSIPVGVAYDTAGVLYVADSDNNQIRSINIGTSLVNTFAGYYCGNSPAPNDHYYEPDCSLSDGIGTFATFSGPMGLSVGANGTLFVADTGFNLIRSIDGPTRMVNVLAGFYCRNGNQGCGAANGIGTYAQFSIPRGVAFDSSNRILFVVDSGNGLIRAIDLSSTAVTTLAGGGSGISPADFNAVGTYASFSGPSGIVVGNGAVYVADTYDNLIRSIFLHQPTKMSPPAAAPKLKKVGIPSAVVVKQALGQVTNTESTFLQGNRLRSTRL